PRQTHEVMGARPSWRFVKPGPSAQGGVAMFESRFGGFDTDIFNEFKRLESEMLQLFGSSPWPAGIRAMQRGAFPPLNVGTTPERVDVYLFAAGLDPKSLDLSIQQNLLAVSGKIGRAHV